MTSKPKVSIVIVNFNGKKWLTSLLPTVALQTYQNVEVIIVDNGSSDDSVTFVRKNFPNIVLICNSDNLGFAEGNNKGVDAASGEYYFLLNNDTQLCDHDLISNAIKHMNANPKIAVLQPKICLLSNHDKIDLCGSFWTETTMLYHYGCYQDEDSPLFSFNFPVFTCKGAAVFVSKKCVDSIGLFDSDFWCYYEETDFCHRAWLNGFECWYFSSGKVLHANGGTSLQFENDYIQYHNTKNKLRSFIKNFRGFERVSVVVRFTLASMLFMLISLYLRKPKNILSVFRAYIWNFQKLFKNNSTQKQTLLNSIPPAVIRSPGLRYYIDLVRDLKQHNYEND